MDLELKSKPIPKLFGDILREVLENVTRPERLNIPQAVGKYRVISHPIMGKGLFDHNNTPYMVEPMEVVTDLRHEAMVLVGPAQMGKTEMLLNIFFYITMFDPCDMKLVQPNQKKATEFSITKLDMLLRDNPMIKKQFKKDRNSNNRFTKILETGAVFELAWPTVNTYAGSSPRIMANTDYDRFPESIGGEGDAFSLSQNRTKTFKAYGMNIAESSPSRDIVDPQWIAKTPHEAPPTTGILGLYNEGDRRRWYWRCVNCDTLFEPHWDRLRTEKRDTIEETAATVWMECTCGQQYFQNGEGEYKKGQMKSPSRRDMNIKGIWLADGDTVNMDGTIKRREGMPSLIASFWLNGVAAFAEDWWKLIIKEHQAQEFRRIHNGDESKLKSFYNASLGMPYKKQAIDGNRLPEDLKKQKMPMGTRETPVVPADVRFLIAAVDVQKDHFPVQIHGIGLNNNIYVIDQFDLTKSRRINEASEDKSPHNMSPFTEPNDWKILLDEVIMRQYPLCDKTGNLPCPSGRKMQIFQTVCDTGGQHETTQNAYEFDDWLRMGPTDQEKENNEWGNWRPGLLNHFILFKGRTGTDMTPLVEIRQPVSSDEKAYAKAIGKTNVLFGKSNTLKTYMDYNMRKVTKESGAVWYADWLLDDFFLELCAETRDDKGRWLKTQGLYNEAWDCICMASAVMYCEQRVDITELRWDNPPRFALPWDENPYIVESDGKNRLDKGQKALHARQNELGRILGG